MKVFGVVYLIQNLVNGKKYVGQTIKTVKERFGEHACQNSAIGRAIRKYSRENFRYGVIKSCASKEELDYWEKFFIAALKTKSPNGCNLTDGGEGTVGLKHTPEHNAKIAAAHKGKSFSPNIVQILQQEKKARLILLNIMLKLARSLEEFQNLPNIAQILCQRNEVSHPTGI